MGERLGQSLGIIGVLDLVTQPFELFPALGGHGVLKYIRKLP